MERMEIESLNKHLAKVMGWKQHQYDNHFDRQRFYNEYRDSEGNRTEFVKDWNPTENIEQSFMVLDTFGEWEVFKDHDYFICINPKYRDPRNWDATDPSLPMAISLACARATNWIEK